MDLFFPTSPVNAMVFTLSITWWRLVGKRRHWRKRKGGREVGREGHVKEKNGRRKRHPALSFLSITDARTLSLA